MKAKKSLGQHFLKSEKALETIVRTAGLKKSDTVLEIGPGQGVLTERLLEKCSVIAVEKDDDLYEMLGERFAEEISDKRLTLVHGDILKFESNKFNKVVANIPYNITGAILEKFLGDKHQPEKMVLLVQKEVASRIVSRDSKSSHAGRGKESILSLSVKSYGTPRFVETVKAGSFAPAPKVDSAILEISDISRDFFENLSEESFFRAVKAGFRSKRKKLASNLAQIYAKESILSAFERQNLDENLRAEDLALEDWKKLVKELE